VRQLLPLVEAAIRGIPAAAAAEQPRRYRLVLLNCGACSGIGRGNKDALLATAMALMRAASTDMAVLLEVPENYVENDLSAELHATAGGGARLCSRLSASQHGERTAFLWDPNRLSLDGNDGADLLLSAAHEACGRAPVVCRFKPVDHHHQLDLTVYGCAGCCSGAACCGQNSCG
jgi:hypothetical protein